MVYQDAFTLMGVGGVFIVLGIASVIWGIFEEKGYYKALASRRGDVREFLEHRPFRPQPAALKIGGWIAFAVGMVLLVVGGAIWFRGRPF